MLTLETQPFRYKFQKQEPGLIFNCEVVMDVKIFGKDKAVKTLKLLFDLD